ncbi:MAG: sugar transferase [candidate division WOR-3 bacterium]|nr:sugar transferase [candidate division WOR-3 bacterium]
MSAYFLSPHPRPIGPFVPYSIGRRLKRIVDLIISLLALLLLALPMLVVAILIKLTSPGPVFYKHRRLGRNMREFDLLKFRTMYKDAGQRLEEILKSDPKKREEFARTFKLKDDPRVTPLGRWLRKFSIDELPQLFNVLVGQMSLVGPRPIVEKEVEYYRDYSLLLFRVPPGLTGLWQVSGRTDTSYEERVKLDTRYVREWTLAGDLVIILKTVPAVLSRRGAY